MARELGAEVRDFDALQHHPNGGVWPPPLQGYSIPETTRAYGALLLNSNGERFCDELGAARHGGRGDRRRVQTGVAVSTTPDGRPGGAARHHPIDPEVAAAGAAVHASPLPGARASTRWPSRS